MGHLQKLVYYTHAFLGVHNYCTSSLASSVFVSHAAPGGKTEALCREIIAMRKPLFTVDIPENANLFSLGAKPVTVDAVAHQWRSGGSA